jgi:hypothetical protein
VVQPLFFVQINAAILLSSVAVKKLYPPMPPVLLLMALSILGALLPFSMLLIPPAGFEPWQPTQLLE